VRTDAPVHMREGGGGRRGSSVFRNAISPVIDTKICQFWRGRQCLSGLFIINRYYVLFCCLLLIDKTRGKEKTYI
jgi:hypothetical protein